MTLSSPSRDVSGLRDYAFDWALVDVETSGVIARRDRVLSVAVVTIGPDGEQTGEFSTLLNPGCDPGPVHVHGLTAERLLGAPTFEQVAGRIGALLQDRVLVAHNAQFDYDFLAHEFARARLYLPVSRRLCTLALNRQVDPPAAESTVSPTENVRSRVSVSGSSARAALGTRPQSPGTWDCTTSESWASRRFSVQVDRMPICARASRLPSSTQPGKPLITVRCMSWASISDLAT